MNVTAESFDRERSRAIPSSLDEPAGRPGSVQREELA